MKKILLTIGVLLFSSILLAQQGPPNGLCQAPQTGWVALSYYACGPDNAWHLVGGGSSIIQTGTGAGGDLSGTYPNPTVTNLNGISSALVLAAVNNSIQSSSIDANGAPNFITTTAGTLAMPINGATTPLNMFIGGKSMTLNTNVALTLASGLSYIYAIGDTTNVNLVAADFIASTIPTVYQYAAPTCSNGANVANGLGGFYAAASGANPQYWFDMGRNVMQVCTSSGGSFNATSYGSANNPTILIGVAWSGGTNIDVVATMPFGMSPINITRNYGSGADGNLTITGAGTTTKDGIYQLSGFSVITGTLTATAQSAGIANVPGLALYSQTPVIIFNGTVTMVGKGRWASTAGGTGVGAAGFAGGCGGAGGGGGGSGATSAAGGAGGARCLWTANGTGGAGTAGAATPTAGSVGQAANGSGTGTTPFQNIGYMQQCSGSTGGNGAGDGTNNGGTGGNAGGCFFLRAPTVVIAGTGIVQCDGQAGATGAGGNAAGAGGGGGGTCQIAVANPVGITVGTNLTAVGGSGGTKAGAGTGTAGGAGGLGIGTLIRTQ